MPVPLPERYIPKYGDPVRYERKQRTLPVSDFCQIMETWAWTWMKPLPTDSEYQKERRKEFAEHWRYIQAKIRKSNLLYRMLCRGEDLRMRPCPTHNGGTLHAFPTQYLKPMAACRSCPMSASANAMTTSPAGSRTNPKDRSSLNSSAVRSGKNPACSSSSADLIVTRRACHEMQN